MPYRSTPADKRNARIIGVAYVLLAILLGWMLFKIWPPIPWPAPKDPDDTRKLLAYLADTGCPEPSPTPTTTATQASPDTSTPATNSQTTPTTSTSTTGQTAPQPVTGGQTGSQTTRQPATATGGTQPSGATTANTPSTTTTPAAPSPAGEVTAKNGVVVDRSGEIISMPINFFGKCVKTTFDERLILLVIVVGILGAFVHAATSLADYRGNNNFNSNWTWFYLLRPAIGMSLALVFYFVIRGGFLSTTGGAQDINPYGIAALAGLVGMFSKQATDKLSEVFGTLFRSAPGEGDAKRQGPLKPTPGTISLEPASVVAGGDAFKLTVSGTGFVDGASIKVNDAPQTTSFESSAALSAQIPKEMIANPATLKITVVDPDGTTFGPVDLVVSAPGGVAPPQGTPPPGGTPGAVTT